MCFPAATPLAVANAQIGRASPVQKMQMCSFHESMPSDSPRNDRAGVDDPQRPHPTAAAEHHMRSSGRHFSARLITSSSQWSILETNRPAACGRAATCSSCPRRQVATMTCIGHWILLRSRCYPGDNTAADGADRKAAKSKLVFDGLYQKQPELSRRLSTYSVHKLEGWQERRAQQLATNIIKRLGDNPTDMPGFICLLNCQ
ncbi:hypothetical protein N656DRAFT_414243 [Canariomyces notabilis]|uniref:Uncharacterized protein n=1 Tax=Canariomyces notabilis TaxID=2074819 RepID=A0AAN6QEE2_9PEZI|nr:hypothetical protein N656DRAFT_414243 [Canariomyces arenarius]